MNLFKQKEKTPSSISHILINKQKGKFPEPLISIRQLEEKDINEVRQLLHDHFNSLTLPAVIYWSIQHIYDLLVIVVINYIFFLDLKKIFYFLIIFLIYLYIRAKLEFLNHIRNDCPDLENLYKSYINVEGCNFWVAEVFDNNFGSASRTTCSDIHEREKILLEQEEQEKLLCNEKGEQEVKNSDEENNSKCLKDGPSKGGVFESGEESNEEKMLQKNSFSRREDRNINAGHSKKEKIITTNEGDKDGGVNQGTNSEQSGTKRNIVNMMDLGECKSPNYNDIYYKSSSKSPSRGVDGSNTPGGGVNPLNGTSEVEAMDDKDDMDGRKKGKGNSSKNGEHGKNSNDSKCDDEGYRENGNTTIGGTNNDMNESNSRTVDHVTDLQNSLPSGSEQRTKLLCNIGDIANKELIESRRTVPYRLDEIRRNIFRSKTNDDDDSTFRFVNRKIVGCVGIVPFKGDNSIAQLVRMVVKKDNRRMRIGSRLLTQLENFAHEQNYQELKVFTNNLNTDSLYFVKQNGFNLSQIVRRGLMRGDLLIWSKILNKDDFYKFNSSGTNQYVKSMNLGEY
ncbi:N-acetyltransferase, putative [Plasmodium knowlesi strain H]|uniref:N-acetyltransferase, putative n=2 Tax=Plasmodium knowlesi (strain H) TaxID=5851 RepID=A0A5E7WVX3_PLAKH|nr:N-acetyltransferase, GNAT family, putative [Plasmodium knowlesi strain H]CAA9986874.1 N-acetyltransferase, GNAT family, putative [Plasmodium knowlesi strain H]SBO23726.1 N-acetyltransferase, putative [Plasmodium knowlesi strain H]SBO25393.1 N-acetyltransferase, putative [Plasmodium knowlesi strain H]VVS76348.1 N-acetyltransferase, GNAT family, putative [Plasmodium knowlesi strain H]